MILPDTLVDDTTFQSAGPLVNALALHPWVFVATLLLVATFAAYALWRATKVEP